MRRMKMKMKKRLSLFLSLSLRVLGITTCKLCQALLTNAKRKHKDVPHPALTIPRVTRQETFPPLWNTCRKALIFQPVLQCQVQCSFHLSPSPDITEHRREEEKSLLSSPSYQWISCSSPLNSNLSEAARTAELCGWGRLISIYLIQTPPPERGSLVLSVRNS